MYICLRELTLIKWEHIDNLLRRAISLTGRTLVFVPKFY